MFRVKDMLKYETYYEYQTKTIYIMEKIKTRHLPGIRAWLIENGYAFENIIIGKKI